MVAVLCETEPNDSSGSKALNRPYTVGRNNNRNIHIFSTLGSCKGAYSSSQSESEVSRMSLMNSQPDVHRQLVTSQKDQQLLTDQHENGAVQQCNRCKSSGP
jgi:hypothetical protein